MTETRTAVCHSRGLDFETVARTRQREERLLENLGLNTTPPTLSVSAKKSDYPSDADTTPSEEEENA